MTAVTWIAIAVLGPGALAVFVAFLRELPRVLSRVEPPEPAADEHGDGPG